MMALRRSGYEVQLECSGRPESLRWWSLRVKSGAVLDADEMQPDRRSKHPTALANPKAWRCLGLSADGMLLPKRRARLWPADEIDDKCRSPRKVHRVDRQKCTGPEAHAT